MSRTPYLDLNIPDKSSKGFVVTDVFEPNFTKLDQEAERLNLRKMSTEDNIEELKKANRYKLGDVVEVLGFHTKGDGSHHKRIAKDEDDGSGELGQNGIWWCVVHNGEVNVSWFGARRGINDTFNNAESFRKAISISKKITIREGFYRIIGSLNIPVGTSIVGNGSQRTTTGGGTVLKFELQQGESAIVVTEGSNYVKSLKIEGVKIQNENLSSTTNYNNVLNYKNVGISATSDNSALDSAYNDEWLIGYKTSTSCNNLVIKDVEFAYFAVPLDLKTWMTSIDGLFTRYCGSVRIRGTSVSIKQFWPQYCLSYAIRTALTYSSIENSSLGEHSVSGFSGGGIYVERGDLSLRNVSSEGVSGIYYDVFKGTLNLYDCKNLTDKTAKASYDCYIHNKEAEIHFNKTTSSYDSDGDLTGSSWNYNGAKTLELFKNIFVHYPVTENQLVYKPYSSLVAKYSSGDYRGFWYSDCSNVADGIVTFSPPNQDDYYSVYQSMLVNYKKKNVNIANKRYANLIIKSGNISTSTNRKRYGVAKFKLILNTSFENHCGYATVYWESLDSNVEFKVSRTGAESFSADAYKINSVVLSNGDILLSMFNNYGNSYFEIDYTGTCSETNGTKIEFSVSSIIPTLALLEVEMRDEQVYGDYIAYRDELYEYEKAQSQVDDTMLLPVLQEPVIPESVELFAKKYNLI